MEILLLSLAIGLFVRNIATDAAWTVRGQDPPSQRRRQARAKALSQHYRAHAPGLVTGRREGRKFVANAWHDAWESASEIRERRHSKKREKRRAKWAERDAQVTKPAGKELDEWVATAPTQPEPKTGTPKEQDTAGAGNVRVVDGEPARRSTDEQERPEPAPSPDRKEQPTSDDMSGPAAGDAGVATVTPLHPDSDTGGSTVTTATGETIGLTPAITYTQEMAESCRQGVASTEQSVAHMQAGEVGQGTIGYLQQAMELMSQAAAAYESAQTELEQQHTVKDAYDANPDAGSKQFLTTE